MSNFKYSNTYLGADYSEGLRHYKYIKKEKTASGKFRYWYADKVSGKKHKRAYDFSKGNQADLNYIANRNGLALNTDYYRASASNKRELRDRRLTFRKQEGIERANAALSKHFYDKSLAGKIEKGKKAVAKILLKRNRISSVVKKDMRNLSYNMEFIRNIQS